MSGVFIGFRAFAVGFSDLEEDDYSTLLCSLSLIGTVTSDGTILARFGGNTGGILCRWKCSEDADSSGSAISFL